MLQTIKKNIKKNKNIYITFIIGIIIISIIFAIEKISPFGKNSTLAIDFYHQYGPMLGELYDRLHEKSNLIYSFSMSGGLPFFRNFLNYLASPLNIIILFFKHKNLLTSFSIIIGLKAVLSGTFFTYFITKKYNTKSPLTIALGILYAFQAYFIAYYWNIMWIDGLMFIPLITLGIERLIDKNSYLLYILSLALMLISNYFIGYMLCIFSALYFLIYLINKTQKKDWKNALKKCGIFAICSLLAGGITAYLTLPLFSSITSTSATGDTTIPLSRYYGFDIFEFIINHLSGVTSTVFSSDITNAPNISVGVISLPLLILFILNKEINTKTKLCYLSILTLLILSFFLAPLDFIWHAFHTPNDLPYRFSFIYSFLLLTICSYSLLNIKKNKLSHIIISLLFGLSIILLAYFFNIDQITNKMIIINAILLGIYFIIYIIYRYYKFMIKIMTVIFIGVIGLETIIRTTNSWEIDQLISDFYYDYENIKNSLNFLQDNDDSKFYRTEQINTMTLNDSSWYKYNGITSFSSMNYENMAKLHRDLGIPGNEINSFYYTPNTPIYNIMFNLKYIIGDLNDYNYYSHILMTEHHNIFENKYNLDLLYGVNENIKNWNLKAYTPIENQNKFLEYSTGIKNVLEPTKLNSKEIIHKNDAITLVKYSFEKNNNNTYFYTNAGNIEFFVIDDILYYKNNIYDNINDIFPEIYYYTAEDYSEKKLINISQHETNNEIYVGYNFYYNDNIELYQLNDQKFKEAYYVLKNNEAKITKFKENKINAKINLPKDMIIYTSIPYDKGWQIYIDGKKSESIKIADTLLGFNIKKGKHKIELKYYPHNMNIGILISLTSIIGIILLQKKKVKN